MKKLVLLSFLFFIYVLNGTSQDIIKTKKGDEYKARLLKLNRKEATFKNVDDAEFSTFTIPYSEISTIQKQGEKKPTYFNHNLARAFIGGSVGFANPLGSYSKTDFESTDKEPGFAIQGASFSLDAGFYLLKNIGLSVSTGRFTNEYDYDAYASLFNGEFSDFTDSYSAEASPGAYKSWNHLYGFIGPMYSLKFSKRLTWDFAARVGFVSTNRPGVRLNHNYLDPNYGIFVQESFYYDSKAATNIGLSGATNIRLMLSKRLSLIVSGNYINSSQSIDTEVSSIVGSIQGINPVNIKIDHKISSINVNIGFAFNFKRKGNKYE